MVPKGESLKKVRSVGSRGLVYIEVQDEFEGNCPVEVALL